MIKPIAAILMFGLFSSLAVARPDAASQPARFEELAYGPDPLQQLDLWRSSKGAPLVVFFHGGGWSDGDKEYDRASPKVAFFRANGIAFASINYRLVPDVPVTGQVQDAADAVGYLAARADALGIDRQKIVLMGHSSGGHLAALIGTDPAYLQKAGVDLATIAGVVLVDGAGLAPDPSRPPRPGGPFATEEIRRKLAPINHVASPNARSFFLLNASSEDLRRQARTMSDALAANGTPASTHAVDGTDHNGLNDNLGREGDAATSLVDAYLKTIFPK
jgi:arylformamidase